MFYLLAGLFDGSISSLLTALPLASIQTLAGSLCQALDRADDRDVAMITSLVTASGISLLAIGAAFWDLVIGGDNIAYCPGTAAANLEGVTPKDQLFCANKVAKRNEIR